MAKLKSLIKIEGTLDGMTFYKGKDGYLVRTKGGVSKNRIENDPAFIRTRENGSEFGQTAKSGKLFRKALTPMLADVKDSTLTARMMKLLSQIKNFDRTSVRGSRNVANGMTTAEGNTFLKGFDFNSNAQLNSVLLADYQLNTTTGDVSITDLNPLQQLNTPSGATHASVMSAVLRIDFATSEKDLQVSPMVNFPINGTPVTINAAPDSVPEGTGKIMFVLKISFFQEINGIQYTLNNGAYNTLHIIDMV
tara:strand:- start:357 stop:1106 length:750 start_codon:yes stop_codon:yes gene_type:complete